MKRRRTGFAATVVVLGLATGGCIWASELGEMRHEIERQMPGAEFEHEISPPSGS